MNLHHPTARFERGNRTHTASTWLHRAHSAVRQLRDLLTNQIYANDHEFRLSLADELLREIESLGLTAGRPTVRKTAAHVRASIGLPTPESTVNMPVETALAFLAIAIDPPETKEASD